MNETLQNTNPSDKPFILGVVKTVTEMPIAAETATSHSNAMSALATTAWMVVTVLALISFVGSIATGYISFEAVAANFPIDVLAILITLDLFSIYVVQTGALDAIGLRLAFATRGRPHIAAVLMGLLMFASSALLNNLAAIFILGPVLLTLLRAMRAPRQITATFLSLILVMCNLGGMATPMGDFPAIMLMSTGIVGFTPYLAGAFPLASSLALIAILTYGFTIRRQFAELGGANEESRTRISLELMRVRNRHIKPDLTRAILLSGVFAGMVLAWARIPPSNWPFFMTALIGAAAATVVAGPRLSTEALRAYDLRTTITMAVILTVAALVSVSGLVEVAANALIAATPGGTLLLVALMVVVAVAAGLFSAGPATAAVLPIFVTLADGPLAAFGDLVGIAFAASICAGSSMMLHSATAGPTLRGEVAKAGFVDDRGRSVWGAVTYLRFGLLTAILQLGLSIAWILIVTNMQAPWLINLVPIGLLLAVAGVIVRAADSKDDRRRTSVGKALSGMGLVLAASVFAYGAATSFFNI